MRRVDAYGRVTVDPDALFEMLYQGGALDAALVEPGPEVDRFNVLATRFGHPGQALRAPEPLPHPPEAEHARRAADWFLARELDGVDLRGFLRDLCASPAEQARIDEEMDLFEAKGLIPLLKTMAFLVDHFRRNKILWGVGRGSSVASFVLYKLGVHKIDALRYGLSIREFLRD